jgi:hypothetical protein
MTQPVVTKSTGNELSAAEFNALMQQTEDSKAVLGTSDGAQDLGTFTGETISDSATVKAALQELETKAESANAKLVMDITQVNPAHQEGTVFYDKDKHALSYHNDVAGVTVNLGQELLILIRNVSGSTLNDGDIIELTGSTGNIADAALADAGSPFEGTVAVVTAPILNNATGYATKAGSVSDLDLSAFIEGDSLWIDPTTAGAYTTTRPTAIGQMALHIGLVLKATPSGILFVDIYGTEVLDLSGDGEVNVALASQAEAEAGTEATKTMTPLQTAQAIAALETGEANVALASQAEAEAGVEATKTMTPLQTAQAIAALGGSGGSPDWISNVVDRNHSIIMQPAGLSKLIAGKWDSPTYNSFLFYLPLPYNIAGGMNDDFSFVAEFDVISAYAGADRDFNCTLRITGTLRDFTNGIEMASVTVNGIVDAAAGVIVVSDNGLDTSPAIGDRAVISIQRDHVNGMSRVSIACTKLVLTTGFDTFLPDGAALDAQMDLVSIENNGLANPWPNVWNTIGYIGTGSTSERPSISTGVGTEYIDRTLGATIEYDGAQWVEPAVGGGEANVALASQAEAEAGVEATKTMTPLQTAQAIAALSGGAVSDWEHIITADLDSPQEVGHQIIRYTKPISFVSTIASYDDAYKLKMPYPDNLVGDGTNGKYHFTARVTVSPDPNGGAARDVYSIVVRGFVYAFTPAVLDTSATIDGLVDYDKTGLYVGTNVLSASPSATDMWELVFISTRDDSARTVLSIDSIEFSTYDDTFVNVDTQMGQIEMLYDITAGTTDIPFIGYIGHGSTANRPTSCLGEGTEYFDRTLGATIEYDGAQWVEPAVGGGEANVALASQAEAEAGVEATKTMTPLRVAEAIAALGGSGGAVAVGDYELVSTVDLLGATTAVANLTATGAGRYKVIARLIATQGQLFLGAIKGVATEDAINVQHHYDFTDYASTTAALSHVDSTGTEAISWCEDILLEYNFTYDVHDGAANSLTLSGEFKFRSTTPVENDYMNYASGTFQYKHGVGGNVDKTGLFCRVVNNVLSAGSFISIHKMKEV